MPPRSLIYRMGNIGRIAFADSAEMYNTSEKERPFVLRWTTLQSMANIDKWAMIHRENNEYLYDNDGDSFKGEARREREKKREIISGLIRLESIHTLFYISSLKFPWRNAPLCIYVYIRGREVIKAGRK